MCTVYQKQGFCNPESFFLKFTLGWSPHGRLRQALPRGLTARNLPLNGPLLERCWGCLPNSCEPSQVKAEQTSYRVVIHYILRCRRNFSTVGSFGCSQFGTLREAEVLDCLRRKKEALVPLFSRLCKFRLRARKTINSILLSPNWLVWGPVFCPKSPPKKCMWVPSFCGLWKEFQIGICICMYLWKK